MLSFLPPPLPPSPTAGLAALATRTAIDPALRRADYEAGGWSGFDPLPLDDLPERDAQGQARRRVAGRCRHRAHFAAFDCADGMTQPGEHVGHQHADQGIILQTRMLSAVTGLFLRVAGMAGRRAFDRRCVP